MCMCDLMKWVNEMCLPESMCDPVCVDEFLCLSIYFNACMRDWFRICAYLCMCVRLHASVSGCVRDRVGV